jgi:hypothetical protein
MAVAAAATTSCYQSRLVKRSVPCHATAQSPPGRGPKGNIQSTIRNAPDLRESVSVHCYLVATIIHIQSVHIQICACVSVCVCACARVCVYIYI